MSLPLKLAAHDSEKRLPPMVGILIAMLMSAALWSAIYAACILLF